MIVRIVKMNFRPEAVEQFLEIFRKSHEQIRGFDGCHHLVLLRHATEPHVFFTYSHWESSVHLDRYRESELFSGVWAATKALFGGKPEAWTCEELFRL